MQNHNAALGLPEDVLIIDADTHLTEPRDLWTSRAPAKYKDRLPRVVDIDGRDTWVFDDVVLGGAGTSSAVMRDGEKVLGMDFIGAGYDGIHKGAWDIGARMEVMDDLGIWAQIVYPNTFGFGGQRFIEIEDADLRLAAVQVFNDASADMQEESGNRMFGMAVLPWWDVEGSVAEIKRASAMGLRGVNSGTGPHLHGLPDLATRTGTLCGTPAPSTRCRSTSTSAQVPTPCRGSVARPGPHTISTTSWPSAPR